MDKNDLKLREKYIWRHKNDNSDDIVEEKVELVSLHGGLLPGQSYKPGEPLTGAQRDPELVDVKVLATGDLADARPSDLSPLP